MRKLTVLSLVACVLLISFSGSHAQVYNTAQKLKSGTFRLCVAPLALVSGGDVDPGIYVLGGIGVTGMMDLYFSTRVANDYTNFGVGMQWALVKGAPALSLTTGAHLGPGIGIDGTFDMTFPAGGSVVLYGGLDLDIDFNHSNMVVPAWLFLGPRVQIKRNATLYLEVDIGMTREAPDILGLGLSFYL
jgi:hypothetical protein